MGISNFLSGSVFSGGDSIMGFLGGLRDDDRNARAAADQRQADERGAERQMGFQSAEASTARGWMENMANTAHQRQAADLQAAGLNRILTATGGGGAPTPSTSAPSGSKATAALQAATSAGTSGVSSAMASSRLKADLENIKVNTRKQDAERRATETHDRSMFQDELLRRQQVETEKVHRAQMEEVLKGMKIEGEIDEGDLGTILRYLNRIFGTLNSARSIGGGHRR